MATERIVPTKRELKTLELSSTTTVEIIRRAQESDAADRLLTVRQALKKIQKGSLLGYVFVYKSNHGRLRPRYCTTRLLNITNRKHCADILSVDQLILRADAIPRTVRCVRRGFRTQAHPCFLAVRTIQLICCWPAGGAFDQRLHSRPLWLLTDYDVLHGLDDCNDIYPCLCTLIVSFSLGRSNVRCFMGSFPGTYMSEWKEIFG